MFYSAGLVLWLVLVTKRRIVGWWMGVILFSLGVLKALYVFSLVYLHAFTRMSYFLR
jgi:hypothetical protein